jgi:hypothetical protein
MAVFLVTVILFPSLEVYDVHPALATIIRCTMYTCQGRTGSATRRPP